MNKTDLIIEGAKRLLNVVKDIRSLADSVQTMCDLITDSLSEKKEIPAPKPEEKKSDVSLEKVRKILADKSIAGYTEEVRAIIAKYGAEKLSEIAPENYEAVIQEAEAL